MPGHRINALNKRDIHFLNSENDEISGALQAGSLTWAEMSQRMHIVFELPVKDYAPFRCLENGDPKDPVRRHGLIINMEANNNVVQPGFYVLLSPAGEPVKIPVNRQMPLPRTVSRSLSGSSATPSVSSTSPNNYKRLLTLSSSNRARNFATESATGMVDV